MSKPLLLLLLGLLVASPAQGQPPGVPGQFSSAHLVLEADSTRIDASAVRVTAERVSFLVPGAPGLPPISADVPIRDIRYLEVRTGDRGGTGALIGAGAGLVAAVVILANGPSHYTNLRGLTDWVNGSSSRGTLALAAIVAGLGVGYLLGSASGTYVPIREDGRWTTGVEVHGCVPGPAAPPLRMSIRRSF